MTLPPIGTRVQSGAVVTAEHTNKAGAVTAVTVTREKTGSTVRVSVRMLAKTVERLQSGPVPVRSISYTSTIEATIVAALSLTKTAEGWVR